MNEMEITKDLIRVLMFFSIFKKWKIDKLLEVYNYLGIPSDLVNETLNEGTEG